MSVEDYSGHLVDVRALLIKIEEAAALGNFGMALAHLTGAQEELRAMRLSLKALADAQAARVQR